jgi:hypothetical protein
VGGGHDEVAAVQLRDLDRPVCGGGPGFPFRLSQDKAGAIGAVLADLADLSANPAHLQGTPGEVMNGLARPAEPLRLATPAIAYADMLHRHP